MSNTVIQHYNVELVKGRSYFDPYLSHAAMRRGRVYPIANTPENAEKIARLKGDSQFKVTEVLAPAPEPVKAPAPKKASDKE